MQKTLAEINTKLDNVLEKLENIEIEQKIIDRPTNARDMSMNWKTSTPFTQTL